ncbi:hypothetical protein Hanom_Chr10g00939951 [Helianthus anomalus]
MSKQTSQWNGMIHFIPLSIPLTRPFHSLIYSITPYQTDPYSFLHLQFCQKNIFFTPNTFLLSTINYGPLHFSTFTNF